MLQRAALADPSFSPDEHQVALLHLLSSGHVDALNTLLIGADEEATFVRLVRADLGMRLFAVEIADVLRLRDELTATFPPEHPLALWAETLVVDALALRADRACGDLATGLLARIGDDPLPPLITLFCRARLRRVKSLAWFAHLSPAAFATHRADRDAAVDDFCRGGFADDAIFTRGITAGLYACLAEEDIVEGYGIVRDARAVLGAHGTVLSAGLDWSLFFLATEMGERCEALAAVDRLAQLVELGPVMRLAADAIRVFSRFGDDDFDPAELEALVATASRAVPQGVFTVYSLSAHWFLDRGHPDAMRFALPSMDLTGAMGDWRAFDKSVLRTRMAIADGQPIPAEELLDLLERIVGAGLPRKAGRLGIRTAGDLTRVDRVEDAATVCAWARPHLPEGRRRTACEREWIARLDQVMPATAVSAGDRAAPPVTATNEAVPSINVLQPVLGVDVDGQSVILGELPARLLLALVLAHPAPLHVEAAAGLLWPAQAFDTVRNRMNSVVHRLRRALGGATSTVEVIVRRDDVIGIDPDRVSVDLLRFRRSMNGDADDRLAALAGVRGNLCAAQFPYDEGFLDHRHAFLSTWMTQARACVRTGTDPRDLSAALTALDLTVHDLID